MTSIERIIKNVPEWDRVLSKLVLFSGFSLATLSIGLIAWLSGFMLWLEEWPPVAWIWMCAATFFMGVGAAVPTLVLLERSVLDYLAYRLNPKGYIFPGDHKTLALKHRKAQGAIRTLSLLSMSEGSCPFCGACSEELLEDPFNQSLHLLIKLENNEERICPLPSAYLLTLDD